MRIRSQKIKQWVVNHIYSAIFLCIQMQEDIYFSHASL
ncbi:hypothetical protein A5C_A0206 [Vibrio cholerae NCTC 8457]|nr:hypothetical protein ASZ85_02921 [Vibrio cholerae]EAZ75271.1 hypothetical protein A5C_A0206 [Vibrio cholerae NCTC 8457]